MTEQELGNLIEEYKDWKNANVLPGGKPSTIPLEFKKRFVLAAKYFPVLDILNSAGISLSAFKRWRSEGLSKKDHTNVKKAARVGFVELPTVSYTKPLSSSVQKSRSEFVILSSTSTPAKYLAELINACT